MRSFIQITNFYKIWNAKEKHSSETQDIRLKNKKPLFFSFSGAMIH